MVVKGRIVDFININKKDNYADFLFRSDLDKEHPRFSALCEGYLPNVVPGVPIKVEFPTDIITVDRRFQYDKKIDKRLLNHIASVSIDFQDEDHVTRSILSKVVGISDKTANKILDALGGDLNGLTERWDDQEFWKQIGRSKRILPKLRKAIEPILEANQLFEKYGQYGIGYPQLEILSSLYGKQAEMKLRENPYMVLPRLNLPFQVADHLAKDLGISCLDVRRIKAIICYVLRKNEENGNTCMHQGDFYNACIWLHKGSAWKDQVISPGHIMNVIDQMDRINHENGLIGFMGTFEKEMDIAYQIHRLLNTPTELHTSEDVFSEIKNKYNDGQIDFLRVFDKNSVTLLLGRGGTGKTHAIRGAIDLFKRCYPEEDIRLCAPTGRAAGVLKESTGYNSSTIHVALGLRPHNAVDEADVNKLNEGLVVVDEMSMVDTEIMYYLLRAVRSGAKLVLCGDPDQLESVGCGSVLSDLIRSGSVPMVKLHKIMRQSEGSVIADNCSKILEGKADLTETDSFRIFQCQTESEAIDHLKQYRTEDKHLVQILTTTNKGPAGTFAINSMFEQTGQEYVSLPHGRFRIGDKVIFNRNNYQAGYCNGDIGYVKALSIPLQIIKQEDNEVIMLDKTDNGDIEHADAITIHKSQGSEYQKVYIILPEKPNCMLTRNMLNTAISRARNEVELIVVGNALKVAASDYFHKKRLTKLQDILLRIQYEDREGHVVSTQSIQRQIVA